MKTYCRAIALLLALRVMSAVPAQTRAVETVGKITGRVLLPDGSPAADMRVAAMAAPPDRTPNFTNASTTLMSLSHTDDDGRYVLTNVPPGRYFVVAGPLDELVYFPGVTSPSKATTVTVTAGETLNTNDLRFTIPAVFSIRGRVIHQGHVFGLVVLTDETGASVLSTAIGPDGLFLFPKVRSGTYRAWLDCTSPMEVVVDREITNLEIMNPQPSAATDVRVLITTKVEGGGPLPYFAVGFTPKSCPAQLTEARRIDLAWKSPTGGNLFNATSEQQFPVGVYSVSATTSLPTGYSLNSIMSGSTDLLIQPLIVTTSGGVPPIAITFGASSPPPWVKLKGKISHFDEAKVAPREFRLEPDNFFPLSLQQFIPTSALLPTLTAEVAADGTFEIPKVRTGTYWVRLGPLPDGINRKLTISNMDGEVVDVDIPLIPPLKQVSGTVTRVLPVAERLDTIHVELRPLGPQAFSDSLKLIACRDISGTGAFPPFQSTCPKPRPPSSLPTDGAVLKSAIAADGSFAFTGVEPRNYVITLVDCVSGTCVDGQDGLVSVFDRDIGGQILVGRGALVNGRVVVEGEAEAPSTNVFMNGVSSAVSGPDGRFSLTAGEGEYELEVGRLPFGYVLTTITRGNVNLRTQRLRVSALDRDEVLIHLALDPTDWATVSGRVIGADTRHGPIRLTLRGGKPGLTFVTEVNVDGTFSISGVPQGRYDVSLSGRLNHNVADALIVGETIGNGIHKADDVEGMEIVVPHSADGTATIRLKNP